MDSKSITIIASALLILGLLELFLRQPFWWPFLLAGIILIVAATLWYIVVDPIISKNYLFYLSSPLLFVISIGAFIALTEEFWVQQAVIIVGSLLYWFYLHNVHLFNFNYEAYSQHAIENVSAYVNLISFFLLSISLFASLVLIGAPLWLLSVILLVWTAVTVTQAWWVANISTPRTYLYSLIFCLLILQTFWAFSFLPTNFYVNGFLLTIIYYVSLGLFKGNLLDILTKKLAVRYLALGGITALLVIITSSWI